MRASGAQGFVNHGIGFGGRHGWPFGVDADEIGVEAGKDLGALRFREGRRLEGTDTDRLAIGDRPAEQALQSDALFGR